MIAFRFVIDSVMIMLDEIKHDAEQYKPFVVTSILVGTIIGNGLLGVFADKVRFSTLCY